MTAITLNKKGAIKLNINEKYLKDEFWRWVKNHNGKIPGQLEMQSNKGYLSYYQYIKFYKTTKWNEILNKMGVNNYNNKFWNEDELLFLKNNWDKMTDKEIANKLNRTAQGVGYKRNELGLYRQPQKQFWKDWEIEYLKTNFCDTKQHEIEKALSHRKWETIRAYATKNLKLKRKNHLYKYSLGNGMRICKKCENILKENEDNFYKDKNRSTYRSYCKKCWVELYYEEAYGENYKEVHYELYKNLYDFNNEKCDSLPEKIITNWLIKNNIKYIKYPYYNNYIDINNYYKFDWVIFINDEKYFVEYFGLWSPQEKNNKYLYTYAKKTKEKIKILYKNKLMENCVLIFPYDFKNKSLSEIFAGILLKKYS